VKALVTGATGFVGSTLLKKLIARGDTVRGLVRKTSRVDALKQMGVELAEGDITSYDSVLEAVRGMDHVFHCAAQMGIGTAPRSRYFDVNAGGARNVVKACEQAGIGTLVYTSTQAVTFNFTAKHNADEKEPFPLRYRDVYSETKALGEREVLDAGRDGRLRACAIRPTFIWGPGDRLMLPTIAKMARQNQLFLIGGGRSEISPSHVENVCNAIMRAADKDDVSGEAFLVTDGRNITIGEFLKQMVAAAGLPPPKKSIPYPLAFALAAVVEKIHEFPFIKTPPSMSRHGVAIMGLDLTFSCEKARRMLGYRPAVSIDEGMERLAKWIDEIGGIDVLAD
jgi:nucleoside-diphosphate-sugar epimerase